MGFLPRLRAYFRLALAIKGLAVAVLAFHLSSLLQGYNEQRGFRYRQRYIRFLISLLHIRVTSSGDATIPNALYACNHRMMIDPVILLRYATAYMVSKGEVAHYPILGNGARHTGVIFVSRQNKDSRAAIRTEMARLFRLGKSVAIFPEGTVNLLPLTGHFYPGSFEVAAAERVAVVPVALDYADTGLHWQQGQSLITHFLNAFSRRRIDCFIHYCEPLRNDDPELLLQACKEQIDHWLATYRKNPEAQQMKSL